MNHIAPLHEPLIREVPLSRLALAPENVSKTPADPVAEAEMKASIAAGGRRLAALKALAGTARSTPTTRCPAWSPPIRRRRGELSLAENIVRIAMHPADQVTAFTRLADAGLSFAAIAARFGTSERLVEQRLRLGNVAPDLLGSQPVEQGAEAGRYRGCAPSRPQAHVRQPGSDAGHSAAGGGASARPRPGANDAALRARQRPGRRGRRRAHRRDDGGNHERIARSAGAHAMKIAVCNRRHGVRLWTGEGSSGRSDG